MKTITTYFGEYRVLDYMIVRAPLDTLGFGNCQSEKEAIQYGEKINSYSNTIKVKVYSVTYIPVFTWLKIPIKKKHIKTFSKYK